MSAKREQLDSQVSSCAEKLFRILTDAHCRRAACAPGAPSRSIASPPRNFSASPITSAVQSSVKTRNRNESQCLRDCLIQSMNASSRALINPDF